MLVTLEPKTTFQKDDDQIKAFRAAVDSASFKEGVHKAIAEFVLKHKPTAEELEGVRRFLDVLINMGEKEEPIARASIMQSIATKTPKTK